MTITIDKFGRILIPKSIRKELGLEPGTVLDLSVLTAQKELQLKPVVEKTYVIEYTEWGWPVITSTLSSEKSTFSIPDFINQSREERADQISGNYE
jgi:AbrB family looped-hinge helix DNA binding protein